MPPLYILVDPRSRVISTLTNVSKSVLDVLLQFLHALLLLGGVSAHICILRDDELELAVLVAQHEAHDDVVSAHAQSRAAALVWSPQVLTSQQLDLRLVHL